ncbi:uncharacterized protein [Hyperolius riggenbachi]|uniref:uncharacterized protein isoform X2 n=1 Tax=Hyperolius riggenbachi TaxID=752182 RepID=UPI0035A3814E
MERKRLRVDGIPTDIPAERAKDKLTIHFQMTRNGGGDVEEIKIIPGPPPHAIILFEEDNVIESVLKIKPHILRFSDKKYHLDVSNITDKLELDEVFQKSSLTVNYKTFPEKIITVLKNLKKINKQVKFDFFEKSTTCEISGPFTEIQALSQEIIRKLELGHPKLKEAPSYSQRTAKTDKSTPKIHSAVEGISQAEDHQSLPHFTSTDAVRSFPSNEPDEQLLEPFVWDSDVFRYIKQLQCAKYWEILDKYHVQAVDESCDGITTILLQTKGEGYSHIDDLRNARISLLGLYQDLEPKLRKEQIDKRNLTGDKNMFADLKKLCPSLLCHEDEQYIVLVGNSVDVAAGKQYIMDVQSVLKRPTSFTEPYNFQSTGRQWSERGQRQPISSLYNPGSYDSIGAGGFSPINNSATDSSSYSRTQLDEKYLTSSNNSKLLTERLLDSDRACGTIDNTTSAYPSKAETFGLSHPNETSASKNLAPVKRLDVIPALRTGRDEIRQSKTTSKAVGPLKPVRIANASSDLAYSSLVDIAPTFLLPEGKLRRSNSLSRVNTKESTSVDQQDETFQLKDEIDIAPSFLDYKIPEGKLRRSNSLSRVYTKESTSVDQQDKTFQLKDEIEMENWLWHYVKKFHKAELDTWCNEVTLTEETNKEKTVVKLKAVSRNKLGDTKHRILLLYWEKGAKLTKSLLHYSDLGLTGPDDQTVEMRLSVFYNCSDKLCTKLEKDAVLLIYPKEVKEKVENILERLNKLTEHLSLTNANSAVFSHTKEKETHTKELRNESDYPGENVAETYLEALGKHQPKTENISSSEPNDERNVIRSLDAPKSLLVCNLDECTDEKKAFFSSLVPSFQGEDKQRSPQLQECPAYYEEYRFFENPDGIQSKSSLHINAETTSYDSTLGSANFRLEQKVSSSSNGVTNGAYSRNEGEESNLSDFGKLNFSEMRIPAAGQESEKSDRVCDHCKNPRNAKPLSCGHYMCDNCQTASLEECCLCRDFGNKNTLKATMTCKDMTVSIPGYQRDTSFKIEYKVPDGMQGEWIPRFSIHEEHSRFAEGLGNRMKGHCVTKTTSYSFTFFFILGIKTYSS